MTVFWPISEHKFYANGQIYSEFQPDFSATWEYQPFLSGRNVEYALYRAGAGFNSTSLTAVKDLEIYNKINNLVKIEPEFLDRTLPEHILKPVLELRLKKIQEILERPRDPDYDFLLNFRIMIDDIASRELKLTQDAPEELKKRRNVIYAKQRGLTGRLKLEHNSFPIHGLTKDKRSFIVPNNDLLVELDYNACDLRCMHGVLGYEQEQDDPYDRINEDYFGGKLERAEIKRRVYAFAYNDQSHDDVIDDLIDKRRLVAYAREQGYEFPAGKEIAYLIQKTSSDTVLRAKVKIFERLRKHKSYVAFSIHDCVVIDLAEQDKDMISELLTIFENTQFGKFKVNIKIGKNFGEMQKIQ